MLLLLLLVHKAGLHLSKPVLLVGIADVCMLSVCAVLSAMHGMHVLITRHAVPVADGLEGTAGSASLTAAVAAGNGAPKKLKTWSSMSGLTRTVYTVGHLRMGCHPQCMPLSAQRAHRH